jgi:hypothetical protein
MRELADWDSFYVILGSSAGALVGLQFVVITLLAQNPPKRVAEANQAFSTPTVIYFSAVLFISALTRVPWQSREQLAGAWGVTGLAGVIYVGLVFRKMLVQKAYRPELEDWIFHAVLPLAAFAIIAIAAAELDSHFYRSVFGIAGAVLLLLFVGIHNAWDGAVYHVLVRSKDREER